MDVARGISTDGGPPAWAVKSCCLDGRVGPAKQQGKRVAHRLSKWPTDMEIDGIIIRLAASYGVKGENVLQVEENRQQQPPKSSDMQGNSNKKCNAIYYVVVQ